MMLRLRHDKTHAADAYEMSFAFVIHYICLFNTHDARSHIFPSSVFHRFKMLLRHYLRAYVMFYVAFVHTFESRRFYTAFTTMLC